jgi:hypothetical protein
MNNIVSEILCEYAGELSAGRGDVVSKNEIHRIITRIGKKYPLSSQEIMDLYQDPQIKRLLED